MRKFWALFWAQDVTKATLVVSGNQRHSIRPSICKFLKSEFQFFQTFSGYLRPMEGRGERERGGVYVVNQSRSFCLSQKEGYERKAVFFKASALEFIPKKLTGGCKVHFFLFSCYPSSFISLTIGNARCSSSTDASPRP
ncbi:hypothetical protein BX666DRAFT_841202 [Dichotomocladium elegans]|nr:hypothetical protein BX666DRAFT_841202 [Dichotomocladium elegans]